MRFSATAEHEFGVAATDVIGQNVRFFRRRKRVSIMNTWAVSENGVNRVGREASAAVQAARWNRFYG